MRLLLLLALFLPTLACAQAWTHEPGRGYAKLSVGLAGADERYDATGAVVPYDARLEGTPGRAFTDRSVYLYGEYGLLENLTVVGMVPLKRLTVQDPGSGEVVEREGVDLGTARVALRLGVEDALGLDARSALAVTLGLNVPLGYRRNVAPAVGTGQVDAELLVAYGRSLSPWPAYAQVAAGYRLRTGLYGFSRRVDCARVQDDTLCTATDAEIAYSDEWLARAEAGYTLFDRLLLQAMADVVWSVEAPQEPARVGGVVQPEGFAQQRFVRVGGGGSFRLFGETALSVQAFSAVSARNAIRAAELFVGLETRF